MRTVVTIAIAIGLAGCREGALAPHVSEGFYLLDPASATAPIAMLGTSTGGYHVVSGGVNLHPGRIFHLILTYEGIDLPGGYVVAPGQMGCGGRYRAKVGFLEFHPVAGEVQGAGFAEECPSRFLGFVTSNDSTIRIVFRDGRALVFTLSPQSSGALTLPHRPSNFRGSGQVAEWLKAPVSKTGIPATVS